MGFETFTCSICGKTGLTRRQTSALPNKTRACREHKESQEAAAANKAALDQNVMLIQERRAPRDRRQMKIAMMRQSLVQSMLRDKLTKTLTDSRKTIDYLNRFRRCAEVGEGAQAPLFAGIWVAMGEIFDNFTKDLRAEPTASLEPIFEVLATMNDALLTYPKDTKYSDIPVDQRQQFVESLNEVTKQTMDEFKKKVATMIPTYESAVAKFRELVVELRQVREDTKAAALCGEASAADVLSKGFDPWIDKFDNYVECILNSEFALSHASEKETMLFTKIRTACEVAAIAFNSYGRSTPEGQAKEYHLSDVIRYVCGTDCDEF